MMFENSTKLKGFAFMFLSSSCMGGIGAFSRYINTSGDVIAFTRSFAGIIGILIVMMVTRRLVNVKKTRFSISMLFSGIFLGLLSMLYVMSTQMTTLSNAAFLIYTGPIYSTILATLFLKEPFTKITAMTLGSVFLGCLMIIGIINYSPESGFVIGLDLDPKYFVGNMIALLSGVAYGLFLFVSRYRTDVDGDVRSFYNFIFAVLTIGSFIVILQPDISQMDSSSWTWLIVAALITGFLAFTLLTVAAKYLMASELACISYQETIMATVLGIALFSESMSLIQGVGGALIIASGIAQVVFSSKSNPVEDENIKLEAAV